MKPGLRESTTIPADDRPGLPVRLRKCPVYAKLHYTLTAARIIAEGAFFYNTMARKGEKFPGAGGRTAQRPSDGTQRSTLHKRLLQRSPRQGGGTSQRML